MFCASFESKHTGAAMEDCGECEKKTSGVLLGMTRGAMQVIPQRATMTTGHQVQTRTKDTCNQRICLFNTHSFIHPRLPIPISTSLSHTPRSPLPPTSHQILVTGTATIHSVPNTHATHNQPPQWYYKEKKGPRRIKRNFRRLSRQMRMLKAESS